MQSDADRRAAERELRENAYRLTVVSTGRSRRRLARSWVKPSHETFHNGTEFRSTSRPGAAPVEPPAQGHVRHRLSRQLTNDGLIRQRPRRTLPPQCNVTVDAWSEHGREYEIIRIRHRCY